MYVCDIIAAFVICSGVVVGAADWGYSGDHGPSTWSDIEGSYCGNSNQSPINIVTDQTEENSLGEFVFNGYKLTDSDAGNPSRISNNGHTLEVSLSDNYVISGGGLPAKYKAAQFHFHWGSQSGQGSEHTVDGKMYDAEMHIVHYNEKYDSVGEAVNDDDQDKAGLAVLGVFLEIGEEDNDAFAEVFDLATEVEFKDNSSSFDEDTRFSVADLLPNDLKTYYRYDGSLTTPGCNEIVIWTVFEEAVSISQAQMNILRNLYEGSDNTTEWIQNNYRPVQELNDRVVYRNSATAITSALAALLLAAVVHVLRLV